MINCVDDIPCDNVEKLQLGFVQEILKEIEDTTSCASPKTSCGVVISEVTTPNQIKERFKYKNKVAKQLKEIGVDIDLETGIEKKSEFNKSRRKVNAKLFESVVEETKQAFKMSDSEMGDWDHMRETYEQKNFNSYQEQRHDHDPHEKHSLGLNNRISPAKGENSEVRLYVSNIPNTLDEDGMRNLFMQIGECMKIYRSSPKHGSSTTYGFVSFKNVRDAEAAIRRYNNFDFGGTQKLKVQLAKSRSSAVDNSGEELFWGGNENVDFSQDDEDGMKEKTSQGNAEVSRDGYLNSTDDKVSTEQIKENPRLFVQGLHVKTTENELNTLFSKVGRVVKCDIVMPVKAKQYTTYGFVTMSSLDEAEAAIKRFNGFMFKNKEELEVKYSKKSAQQYNKPVVKNTDQSLYDDLYNADPFENVPKNDDDDEDDDNSNDIAIPTNVPPAEINVKRDRPQELNEKMNERIRGMLLADLPVKPFPDEEQFSIGVTELVSPNLIYANIYNEETISMLQVVTEKLATMYGDASSQEQKQLTPSINELCVAKYTDGLWYRAAVISYNADGTIRVIFIDFGNKADVAASDVYSVHTDLLEYPQLALKFSVADIQSPNNDSTWSDNVIQRLGELLCGVVVNVQRVSIENDKMVCKMSANEVDVGETLIKEGLAVMPRFLTRQLPSQVALPISVSDVDVIFSYPLKPDELYIWYKDLASVIEFVQGFNAHFISQVADQENLYTPVIGELCAGFVTAFEEWYRVDVLEVTETGAQAKLIDYGNVVEIPFAQLRPIQNKFTNRAPQCYIVKLNDLIPSSGDSWSEETVNYFQNNFFLKKGKMTVSEITEEFTSVVVSIEDQDVGETLCSLGYCKRKSQQAVARVFFSDMKQQTHTGSTFESFITNINNPHDFHGQITGHGTAESYAKITQIIANIVSNNTVEEYCPLDDEICLGFPETFGEWYRVRILQLCEGKAKIKLIDFGDTIETPFAKLRPLPKELVDFPPLAVQFSLSNVKLTDKKNWSENDIKKFQELAFWKICQVKCTVEKSNDSSKRNVDIFLEDGISVSERLISEGLAESAIAVSSTSPITNAFNPLPNKTMKHFFDRDMKNILQVNDSRQMKITSITSPSEFFCYHAEDAKKLNKKLIEFDQNETEPNSTIVPQTGEILLGFSPLFERSIRVQVLAVDGQKVHVTDIDDKHEEWMSINDLNCMPEDIASIPQQLLCFGMYDPSKTSWKPDTIQYFKDRYENQDILINVKSVSDNKYLVSFSTDYEEDVLTHLKQREEEISKQSIKTKIETPIKNKIESVSAPAQVNGHTTIPIAAERPNKDITTEHIEVDKNTEKPKISVNTERPKKEISTEKRKDKVASNTEKEVHHVKASPVGIKEQENLIKKVSKETSNTSKQPKETANTSKQPKETANTSKQPTSPVVSQSIDTDQESIKSLSSSTSSYNEFQSKLPDDLHPMDSVSLKMPVASLNQSATQVLVRQVISPDMVYATLLNEHMKCLFEKMLDDITKYCVNWASQSSPAMKAGTLCIVKENSSFLRAVITKTTSDSIGLYCVDSGKEITVDHDAIKVLPPEFKTVPAQVIRLKLVCVKPVNKNDSKSNCWSEEACEVFKNIIMDKQLRVKCELQNNGVYYVKMKLQDSDDLVDNLLIDSGHAEKCEKDIPTNSGLQINTRKKPQKLKKGVDLDGIAEKIEIQTTDVDKPFNILVSCVVSPRLFYGMLFSDNILQLDKISDQLRKMFHKQVNKEHSFEKGDLCVVKYIDNRFYRGFINEKENTQGNYSIFLIDYGEKGFVSTECVWPLPNEFKKLPAQAMTFQLQYITPINETTGYTDEAVKYFKHLVEEKSMSIEVKKIHGYIYRVNMYSKETGEDIAANLVENRFAKYLPLALKKFANNNSDVNPSVRSPGRIMSQLYAEELAANTQGNYQHGHRSTKNSGFRRNTERNAASYDNGYFDNHYYDRNDPYPHNGYNNAPQMHPRPLMSPYDRMEGFHHRDMQRSQPHNQRRGNYAENTFHHGNHPNRRFVEENGEDTFNNRDHAQHQYNKSAGGMRGRGRGRGGSKQYQARGASNQMGNSQNGGFTSTSRGRGFPKY